MADCLGLYIQKHLIKYAKVSSEGDRIKIITSGVKSYTNVKEAISQIVSETDSERIPVSVNITGETYKYFYMSSLLSKKDLDKSINTEFEMVAAEDGNNPNAIESRYALVNELDEKNKIRVIHVSEDKIKINQIDNLFKNLRLTTLSPISFSIANIVPLKANEKMAVVNIEDNTFVTTIVGKKVYEVEKIPVGANKFLEEIASRENSYSKAYNICKNTTIYTMEQEASSNDTNGYLSSIIPSLYEIAIKVRNIVAENNIKKVYLTGLGSIINNIDLYFNEIVGEEICEVLKPFFLADNAQVNVKDSIEANSAIAMALQGLNYGIKNMNFKPINGINLSRLALSLSIGSGKKKKKTSTSSGNSVLSMIEQNAGRGVRFGFVISLAIVLIYSGFSLYTAREMKYKESEMEEVSEYTTEQISKIKKDTGEINEIIKEYTDLTKDLQNAKDIVSTRQKYKNSIPALLSGIYSIIPDGVQLLSIENPSDNKISIVAQSLKYEQLAYFKAKIKEKEILVPSTVTSSQAVKANDDKLKIKVDQKTYLEKQTVQVVIEGDLKE